MRQKVPYENSHFVVLIDSIDKSEPEISCQAEFYFYTNNSKIDATKQELQQGSKTNTVKAYNNDT